MVMVSLKRRMPRVVLIVLLALGMSGAVQAQMTEYLKLQDMVDRADQIVVGTCTERWTGVENGVIVTHYKLKPSEFWKGSRPLSPEGDFTMTEPGGILENSPVPLGQYVPGSSDMLPGEDVLLFLADPQPARNPRTKTPPPSKTMKMTLPSTGGPKMQDSPRVVGVWQGRYSVVTNPRNGKKMVSKTNVSPVPGSPINTAMREKLLRAQNIKITTSATGSKVAVKDKSVDLSREKFQAITQQLDSAAEHARQQHEELVKKVPAAADEIYPFESVDAVKARVLRMAKSQKSKK